MRSLRLVTGATAEPVDIDDLKLHLGIDATQIEEDELLGMLIETARKEAENKTHRLCLPQTWKLNLDDFGDEMILPWAPLSSNTTDVAITYLDSASGNSTSLSTSYYTVDVDAEPPRIHIAYGMTWPSVYDVPNAVTIQFKAGYPLSTFGSGTDTTPEGIETWIKMRASGLYEHRESFSDRSFNELPHSFLDGLLDPYTIFEVDP